MVTTDTKTSPDPESGEERVQRTQAPPAQASGSGAAIAVMAIAGILMGAGAVAFVMARTPRTPEFAATAASPSAAPTSTPTTAADPAVSGTTTSPRRVASAASTRPKWTGGVERAGRRAHNLYYELQAENEIAVLSKRVRPVLSVRCVAGTTEAYVLTETAAVIEGDKGSHTVSVALDDGAPQKEAWYASDDYQALFSPDAVSLARRLAGARTLRFGFTPYAGKAEVVEFDVHGFDSLVGNIARSCRWKS